MRSEAATVDAYLAGVVPSRVACLTALRDDCRELLVGFDEVMAYGMPSYVRDGEVEVAFASQQRHIALYVLRTDVMADHRDRLAGLDVGKGAIRYPAPDRVDRSVVRSMLAATAASTGPVC